MSHEPECPQPAPFGRVGKVLVPPVTEEDGCELCNILRAAYQRGYREASDLCDSAKTGYHRGYRAGYNDHAASRAHAEAIYGRYNPDDPSCTGREPHMCGWNQHGKGLENP